MKRAKLVRQTALAAKIADRWRSRHVFLALSDYLDKKPWLTAEPDPVSGHPIADGGDDRG